VTVVVLLLVVGLIALGLPSVSHRDRRRFWHPWLNTGLAPALVGLAAAPLVADDFGAVPRAFLALALGAAGMLVGTQLRLAYLSAAGPRFLRRQSGRVALLWGIGMVTVGLVVLSTPTSAPGWAVLHAGPLLAPLLLVTAQAPPLGATGWNVQHRDLVHGHMAPAGWWNLLALAAVSVVVTGLAGPPTAAATGLPLAGVILLEIGVPIVLGLVLSWLAVQAKNRDEAYLFLLAALGCVAGWSLFGGSSAFCVGMLSGAVFINLSLGRAALIERALEELEQPIAVAVGLFAGLGIVGAAIPWPWWLAAGLIAALRWLLRARYSPTSATLANRSARRLMAPGAAGVLVVGVLVELPAASPMAGLALPAMSVLVLWTLVADLRELTLRRLPAAA